MSCLINNRCTNDLRRYNAYMWVKFSAKMPLLTHWYLNTIIRNWFKFHWSLFPTEGYTWQWANIGSSNGLVPNIQKAIRIGSGNGLVPNRRKAIRIGSCNGLVPNRQKAIKIGYGNGLVPNRRKSIRTGFSNGLINGKLSFNTLASEHNGYHFADNSSKCLL